jgi:hypothetical protein
MTNRFEMAYEREDAWYIRHMTDGRTTLVQVVYRDISGALDVVAYGTAQRRKGDPRNPKLGSALAFMRAHQAAANYYADIVKMIEEGGTLSQQMAKIDKKVAAQVRKEEAKHRKGIRRAEARRRWFSRNAGGFKRT